MNLHDLVSSPDFKEEQINFIMTHHYGINNKPEYMEMIQTIKQRTPVLNSKNNGVELIVEFDEEEMYTDEKGIHSVEFPKVSFYDTFDATHFPIDKVPLDIIIGISMDKTLFDNVLNGNKTKEAIAIHIIDHLLYFMENYE